MISCKVPHMIYGGDYNPEQWPEEVWHQDVRLMREASVNLVSVGIFSWAKLEPQPGEYDFGWLDRIVDLLYENGVMVDLATGTASPPPWLARLHPESLPVTREGITLNPGARQHYCPSSAAYKERASALVRHIADRYKDHPALAMWHVNNEYSVHVRACYCDASAQAFRGWLRERYGNLDALNEAWGTAFWSQRYAEWEEILPPRVAPTFPNPTQQLDYHRFSSDALLECFTMERDVLRETSPDVPVTTNFLGFPKALDLWRWTDEQDIVSVDLYPDPADPEAYIRAAMSHDLMRSLGEGDPWVLMEQTRVRVNWRERNVPKRPGEMRLLSLGAVARGAEGIMFFQWRQSRAGAEKFHSAMVPHVDPEISRSWREVKRLGHELDTLDELLGARGEAETAILLDWENWWALELDSKPSTAVRLLEGVYSFYKPLYEANIPVDFAHPESDLSSYKLTVTPNLYLVTDASAQNINRFVADGGTLLMSFFSGIVDVQDHIRLGGYPAPFRDVLGLLVDNFVPIATGETNRLDTEDGSFGCDLWSDLIHPRGAEPLASYTENFYAGTPAVTRNVFGRGIAYYLGTRPEERYTRLLLQTVCEQAGVAPALRVPPSVDAVRRKTEDVSFLFLLNHNEETVEVRLPEPVRDLLTGKKHDSTLILDPLEVAVLRESSSGPSNT
jgi:beta-galactosidase